MNICLPSMIFAPPTIRNHPPLTLHCKPSDSLKFHGFHAHQDCRLKFLKGILVVFSSIAFEGSLVILNVIKPAVKLGTEYNFMSSCFYNSFKNGYFISEIFLQELEEHNSLFLLRNGRQRSLRTVPLFQRSCDPRGLTVYQIFQSFSSALLLQVVSPERPRTCKIRFIPFGLPTSSDGTTLPVALLSPILYLSTRKPSVVGNRHFCMIGCPTADSS